MAKENIDKASIRLVFGRRPVRELLESDLSVQEVLLSDTGQGSILANILDLCAKKNILIKTITRKELDRLSGGVNHQGVAARFILPQPVDISTLLNIAERRGKPNFPLILLDGVEDPHNLGAIIRSVEVLSRGGVIIRQRRSAGLSPAVVKASAGAVWYVPLAETTNLNQALEILKTSGYWVFGLDMKGTKTIWEADLSVPTAFVLGSEGMGLARLTRELCDELLSIPIQGQIRSLNVSVAAGVTLTEWARQHKQSSKESENIKVS